MELHSSADETIRCWHSQCVCVCLHVVVAQKGVHTVYYMKLTINNPTPFLPLKPFLTYDLCEEERARERERERI